MVKLQRRLIDVGKVSSTPLAFFFMHINLSRCTWKDLKERTLLNVACIWNILELNKYLFSEQIVGIICRDTSVTNLVLARYPRMLVCKSVVFAISNF